MELVVFVSLSCKQGLTSQAFGSLVVVAVLLAVVDGRTCVSAQTLPPPSPELLDESRLSGIEKITVERFNFEGNSVFSDAYLRELAADYKNRELRPEELQELREEISRRYFEAGYVNSGAVIPDQEVREGIVTIRVIEGELSAIDIRSQNRLRDSYISERLMPGTPLNVNELERNIRLLQQDPLIEKIDADLKAGEGLGEATLDVEVVESKPYSASVTFDNYRPPSIGSERLYVSATHGNVSGRGDRFSGTLEVAGGGVGNYWVSYWLPLNASNTTLSGFVEENDSSVQSEPFNLLGIDSEFNSWGVSLTHPFYRDLSRQFTMGLTFQERQTKTFLLDQPFSFSPGVQNGVARVALLQFFQEWIDRSPGQVLAARSSFNFGLDVLDATINDNGPDGQYFAWSGQFQWVKELRPLNSQLLLRGAFQWTGDALLPSEKIAIGGATTVRGYRENLLVRDSAVLASAEWRVPVAHLKIPDVSTTPSDGLVQLALFFDYGAGWDKNDINLPFDDISSLGIGVLWRPSRRIYGNLYWGYGLRDVPSGPDSDLQDHGIHFSLTAEFL